MPARSKGAKRTARAASTVRRVRPPRPGVGSTSSPAGSRSSRRRIPAMDFRLMVKRAYDYALKGVPNLTPDRIDGTRISYFSDHFARQLKAASMVQDYLGLNPKGSVRIEWGGATGGECVQAAYEAVASGRMDVCLAAGFETMSRVATWKGNEFIALASDTNFDFPLGGFYTGYYALMVMRHIYEYLRLDASSRTSRDEREAQRLAIAEGSRIMSLVSVKNHRNALHNPYAPVPEAAHGRGGPELRDDQLPAHARADLHDERRRRRAPSSAPSRPREGVHGQARAGHGRGLRHRHDAALRPTVRQGPAPSPRDGEGLREPPLPRRAFVPGRAGGGSRGVPDGRDHRPEPRSSTSSSSTTPTPRARSRPTRTSGSAGTARVHASSSAATRS